MAKGGEAPCVVDQARSSLHIKLRSYVLSFLQTVEHGEEPLCIFLFFIFSKKLLEARPDHEQRPLSISTLFSIFFRNSLICEFFE